MPIIHVWFYFEIQINPAKKQLKPCLIFYKLLHLFVCLFVCLFVVINKALHMHMFESTTTKLGSNSCSLKIKSIRINK